jgi:hypothetical protein
MARFAVSHNKAGINVANSPMWQLRAPTNRLLVWEVSLSVSGAPTTGPSWQLNRPTATGTATGTPPVAQKEDPGSGTTTAVFDTGWTVAPTLAADYLRRYATPASIGSGITWSWSTPLYIPVGGGLVIVNGNATSTTPGSMNVHVVYEE